MGWGRASALRLADDDRAIVIWDRDAAAAKRTIAELNSRDARAMALEVDVASLESLEAAHATTLDFLGPVDILVNAAAIIGVDASVLETPLDEWDRVLAVNLTGTYLASRLVVGGMAERGWGRIVNFTSGARHGAPALIPYSVSKAGVVPITRAFAREFTSRGVLVNAVLPGRALTNMVLSRVPEEDRAQPARRHRSVMPIPRNWRKSWPSWPANATPTCQGAWFQWTVEADYAAWYFRHVAARRSCGT